MKIVQNKLELYDKLEKAITEWGYILKALRSDPRNKLADLNAEVPDAIENELESQISSQIARATTSALKLLYYLEETSKIPIILKDDVRQSIAESEQCLE